MTTATEKTTLADEAVAKLIDQFRGRPNIEALVRAIVAQNQGVEAAAFDVLTETRLDTAVGAQLDGLGELVGIERGGFSDADYRVRIGARIQLNRASGTIPEILELVELLGGASITLTEAFPAKFDVDVDDPLTNGAEVGAVVVEAKPAGVGVTFAWHESANPFRFDVSGQCFDEGELANSIGA